MNITVKFFIFSGTKLLNFLIEFMQPFWTKTASSPLIPVEIFQNLDSEQSIQK